MLDWSGKDSQGKGHRSWVLPTDLREGIPTRGYSSYKDGEPGTSSKVQKRMASVAGTDGERREMGLRRAGPAAQLGSSHGKGCMQGATWFDFCCRNNSWVWGVFYVKLTLPWGVNANQWSSGLRPGPFRGRPVTHTLCTPAPWGPGHATGPPLERGAWTPHHCPEQVGRGGGS